MSGEGPVRDAALGEVAALALKAARGAGRDWGMAEEAADAVRVLHAHGLDGAALICAALDAPAATDPVAQGAALSDRAAALCRSGPEALPPVAAPALLLPFVLRAARAQSRPLRVTGGGLEAVCLPSGRIGGVVPPSPAPIALTVSPAHPPLPDPLPQATRAPVTETEWNRLQAWAERTYAPATEASRLRGAGAADDPES